MENFKHLLRDYLLDLGWDPGTATFLNMILLLVMMLVVLAVTDAIVRRILLNQFSRIADRTSTSFDDILVKNRVPRNVAHIVPLLVSLSLVPIVFVDYPYYENIIEKGLQVFSIILTIWIIRGFAHSTRDYLNSKSRFRDKPINSYAQVILIITWVIGLLSAFAIVTGVPFFKFMTTLGAASAVILLVFRDTIMGFVASLQVSINDMVHIGDWITFEKFGADGNVIEINLATVKVQNFDKTITTIPTYALISDSFKNWRGMEDSGGRRIKRAIIIKQGSIRFLEDQDIDKLQRIGLISDYITNKKEEIDRYNRENSIDKELLINGRNLTNIGTFRKYVESYIEHHSAINKEMMIMTRQLPPTSQGLPIEIYAFSKDKRWQNYEYIMADIFDHVISSASYFDLKIYELPTEMTTEST